MNEETKELINQIYDTLMGNVGMSEYHTPFPIDAVDYQEVTPSEGEIYFRIGNKAYVLTITETEPR